MVVEACLAFRFIRDLMDIRDKVTFQEKEEFQEFKVLKVQFINWHKFHSNSFHLVLLAIFKVVSFYILRNFLGH